jgi:hypothetical protein
VTTPEATVAAAQPSGSPPPEWRPRRVSRLISACIIAPACLAFAAAVNLAIFSTDSNPVTLIFGLVVTVLSLVIGAQAASVPALRIRVAGNKLEYRNLLWSNRAVPLASVTGVAAAPRGMVISRSDGSEVVAHAVTDPFRMSQRAATTAEEIQDAVGRWRKQWG